jgi:hypothetical protein
MKLGVLEDDNNRSVGGGGRLHCSRTSRVAGQCCHRSAAACPTTTAVFSTGAAVCKRSAGELGSSLPFGPV